MIIQEYVREKLDDLTYFHTKAVVELALDLAEKEGADKEVVEAAAWLHDIGRSKAGLIHHKESVEMSEEFLKEQGKDPEFIEKVCDCINEHVGPRPLTKRVKEKLIESGLTEADAPEPKSKESQCLYDADMINLIGPWGTLKCVHLWTKENIPFKEIVEKRKQLMKLILEDLRTETGKEIGKKEYEYTQKFIDNVKVEE
jgi:uncharacterized protein